MKKLREFNIEDYSEFEELVDIIYQAHIDGGGRLSKSGLRDILKKALESWDLSDGDYILFLALWFYKADPYNFKGLKGPQKYLFEKEYHSYVSLFRILGFIEAAGVKGDLEDLWFDLGYHVRLLKGDDVQMLFLDGKLDFLENCCDIREDLMNEVRHSNLYGAIEDFYKKHPELSASLDLSTIVFIHELKVIIDGIK